MKESQQSHDRGCASGIIYAASRRSDEPGVTRPTLLEEGDSPKPVAMNRPALSGTRRGDLSKTKQAHYNSGDGGEAGSLRSAQDLPTHPRSASVGINTFELSSSKRACTILTSKGCTTNRAAR